MPLPTAKAYVSQLAYLEVTANPYWQYHGSIYRTPEGGEVYCMYVGSPGFWTDAVCVGEVVAHGFLRKATPEEAARAYRNPLPPRRPT